MMLFYKAWRESRTRFLAGAILGVAYCAAMIVFTPGTGAPVRAVDHSHWKYFVDNQLFDGLGKMAFVLPVIFLGLGGLKRERAQHSAIFTLSFPVSRAQLVGAQIVVGLAEMALLAFLPALLIQPLSALVNQSYPIAAALRFCLLRLLCGIEIFSIAFLLSVILRGAYTAVVACWVALLLQAQVANLPPLRPYGLNPLSTMGGRWLVGSIGSNINDAFPWTGLLILMLTAFGLIATATRITQKQSL